MRALRAVLIDPLVHIFLVAAGLVAFTVHRAGEDSIEPSTPREAFLLDSKAIWANRNRALTFTPPGPSVRTDLRDREDAARARLGRSPDRRDTLAIPPAG